MAARREQRSPSSRGRAPSPSASRSAKEPERGYRGTGIWFSVVVALLVAAAFLVFVAQNTDGVNVQWTVWDVDVSLAAVVFGAMLLGSALTLAWARSGGSATAAACASARS